MMGQSFSYARLLCNAAGEPVVMARAIWVDVNKIDFSPGTPSKSVGIYDVHLAGDLTSQFSGVAQAESK